MNKDVKAALDEAQSLGFKLAGQRDAAWVKIEKLQKELAEYRRRDEPMRRGLDAVVNLERGTLRFENGWLVEMNTLGYDFGYDQAPVAVQSNDFGRDDPNAKPPGEREPCDMCAHTLGEHTLVEGSGPRYYDRPCDRASCDCENFKRWTGAQSGTTAPPPQSLGTGLGFSPTGPVDFGGAILKVSIPSAAECHAGIEQALDGMDEFDKKHAENLAAMTMKIGDLERELAEARGDSMGRFYITRRNERAWIVYDRELRAGVNGECGVYPNLEQAERAKRLYEETPDRGASIDAAILRAGDLETAIRHHLYVCPLPSANLRKAIGYKPGVELVRPCSLPFASIEDARGPDPSPFDPICLQCGHWQQQHTGSGSACQWSKKVGPETSALCTCRGFVHAGNASAAP